jgi:hypothetical protein
MAQLLYGPFGRPKADVWLTISGWIWVLYIVGLVLAVVSLSR